MDRGKALSDSWDSNAAQWRDAVREGRIASRKAGTDAAILAAILRRKPRRLLDAGCGEGWLIRRVTQALADCAAVGIDGSADLVADARAADPSNDYRVLSYRDLIGQPDLAGTGYDVVAFNYALFDEEVPRLLMAAATLLAAGGAVVIQTLHPWALAAEGQPYRDGWRSEDFAAFGEAGWTPMPWYFRTLESWHATLREAGLTLFELQEPAAEPGGPPLSLLMISGKSGATCDNPRI